MEIKKNTHENEWFVRLIKCTTTLKQGVREREREKNESQF